MENAATLSLSPQYNRTYLFGHTSPETAVVVNDYPYGYKTRTQIRYWVDGELGSRKGVRAVSQTLNPKTGKWNKPHADTYAVVVVLTRDEATGYIDHFRLTHYTPIDVWRALAFSGRLSDATTKHITSYIKHYDACAEILAKPKANIAAAQGVPA